MASKKKIMKSKGKIKKAAAIGEDKMPGKKPGMAMLKKRLMDKPL